LLLAVGAHGSGATDKKYFATPAYTHRIITIAHRAVDAGLASHPERVVGVSMKLHFQVDSRGHVMSVRVVAGKPDRWAEKTAVRILRDATFPPIPKDVLRELDMDHLEAEADITPHVERHGSNQSLQPTAGRSDE
jgi:TonB family protein